MKTRSWSCPAQRDTLIRLGCTIPEASRGQPSVVGLSEQRNGGQGSRKTRKKLPEISSHLVHLGVQAIWQIRQTESWGDQLSHNYPDGHSTAREERKGSMQEVEGRTAGHISPSMVLKLCFLTYNKFVAKHALTKAANLQGDLQRSKRGYAVS